MHARTIVVWGWNPLSTAPHLWQLILEARRRGARLVVVDPFRSRTARVADEHLRPLPGTDAALALGDHARAARRRARRRASGAARTRSATTSCVERLDGSTRSSAARRAAASPAADDRASSRARSPTTQPSLHAPRRRRPASRGRADRLPHDRLPPGARGLVAPPRRRLLVHPDGMFGALPTTRAWRGRSCARAPARSLNMSQLGEALTDPALDPPVAALVVWNSNPAAIAPDQERVLAGLRARGPVHGRVRAVHDRHRRATPTSSSRPRRSSSTSTSCWSWGHHYLTLNEPAIAPARRGAAEHARSSGCSRAGSALDRPVLRRDATRRCSRRRSSGDPAGHQPRRAARARLREDRPRAGHEPARRGRLRNAVAASSSCAASGWPRPGSIRCRSTTRPARSPTSGSPSAIPLALLTPKTHLFLNSTFANGRRQHAAQPEPFVVIHPDDAAARGIADGASVRVRNDRGALHVPRDRLGRRARRASPSRRWAGGTATTPAGAARRRRRRSG